MTFWVNLAIIAAIIIILIALYIFTRKTPKRYYRTAGKYHKIGESYYNEGDLELADEYYKEAEVYRKKARELENVV
mgnify:CR=1 FL=1